MEDDEGVQRFVGQILTTNDYQVVTVADGSAATEVAADAHPNLVILDLSLPGISGLTVCERLRQWYQGPIIVLSGADDESTIVKALDAGADDYLTKPFRPAELLARLRALLRRTTPQESESSEIVVGVIRLDLARRELFHHDLPIRLTRTEFDILACLLRQPGHVVTSDRILREVWGPHHGEYSQSLRVHIGHIRKKIEADPSAPCYIVTEAGVGYRFNLEDDHTSSVAAAAGV